MISVLIPVYNYNIEPLIKELNNQIILLETNYEIIIIDDASTEKTYNTYKLTNYKNVRFIQLKENIGRSSIRNLLATKAKYDNLLYIDAGTLPKHQDFLKKYINNLQKNVVIGGMVETDNKPKKPYRLRWLFTKNREHYSRKEVFTSANFMVKKEIINAFPFDETITQYGYEDLIFFKTLTYNSIEPEFINNPVIHDCTEDSYTFIRKIEQGLENLATFTEKQNKLIEHNNIIKSYKKLSKFRLNKLIIGLFKIIRNLALKNFKSSYPSMLLFDFYRLGYFCTIKQKE